MVKKKNASDLLHRFDRFFNVFDELSGSYKELKNLMDQTVNTPKRPPQEYSHRNIKKESHQHTPTEEYKNEPSAHCTVVRLTGVSFGSCQNVIQGMKSSDKIILARQPDNPYDANAVAVLDSVSHEQIGWIPRELSAGLAVFMDQGMECRAEVAEITGKPGGLSGVKVRIYTPGHLEKRAPASVKEKIAGEIKTEPRLQRKVSLKTKPDIGEIVDYAGEDDLFKNYLEE